LDVQVKVIFTGSRGYHLNVPSSLTPLPLGFTQAVLNKRSISCTTEEVASLSGRAADAIANALSITQELLKITLENIRDKIEALFTLVDSVVSYYSPLLMWLSYDLLYI